MADKIQSLLVSLEARINGYEKEMKRANAIANKTAQSIETRFEKANGVLNKFGGSAFGAFSKGALLALGPLVSITAAINGAKDALDKFSSISDNAKSTGLDAETFQELAYQAEQGGVEFGEFSKALETFNKSSGLAVVGKGKMIAALKALNPELLANIQAATTQEQRVRLAADAIASADSASQKAALSTALFGEAGAKLADVFSGGSAQIDATAVAARKLGLVIDNDLISRAEAMGDEFSTATQVMDLQFKQALVELAPILIATAKLAGDLAGAINYITDSMQALGQRGTARLEQDLAGLDQTLAQNSATFAPGVVGADMMGVSIDPDGLAKMQAERAALMTELKKRATDQLRIDLTRKQSAGDRDETVYGVGGGGAQSAGEKFGDALKKQAEENRLLAEKTALQAGLNPLVNDYGLAVERLTVQQELQSAATAAGIEMTPALAATIDELAIGYATASVEAAKLVEAQDNARESMQTWFGLGKSATRGFIDDLVEGKTAAEALGNVFGKLGDQLLDMGLSALFGGGKGDFGIIGKALGFEAGGYTGDGARNEVAGTVHKGEYVFTKAQTKALGAGNLARLAKGYANGGLVGSPGPVTAGGGRGSSSVSIPITIDATGADAAGLARVEQRLAQLQSSLPGVIKRTVQRRGKEMW